MEARGHIVHTGEFEQILDCLDVEGLDATGRLLNPIVVRISVLSNGQAPVVTLGCEKVSETPRTRDAITHVSLPARFRVVRLHCFKQLLRRVELSQ